jgi:hypothetical protein
MRSSTPPPSCTYWRRQKGVDLRGNDESEGRKPKIALNKSDRFFF